MTLICIRSFGVFEPGGEVEVPDGAVFDSTYFAEVVSNPKENKE